MTDLASTLRGKARPPRGAFLQPKPEQSLLRGVMSAAPDCNVRRASTLASMADLATVEVCPEVCLPNDKNHPLEGTTSDDVKCGEKSSFEMTKTSNP